MSRHSIAGENLQLIFGAIIMMAVPVLFSLENHRPPPNEHPVVVDLTKASVDAMRAALAAKKKEDMP